MNSKKSYRIVVFEDDDDRWKNLEENLEGLLDLDEYTITRFDPPKDIGEKEPADLVIEELNSPEYPTLVILDRELGKYEKPVSRQHVQIACEEEGIPLCIYHRESQQNLSNSNQFKNDKEKDYIRIDAQKDIEKIARECSIIAKGFVQIRKSLEREEENSFESALFEVLGAPSKAWPKLEQYTWGEPRVFSKADKENESDVKRIATTYLGYFIYNQLLEFPGVLLNKIAAASYLKVDHEKFGDNEEFQDELKEAKYEGPFSGLDADDWWWSSRVDDIRSSNTEDDELDLVNGPEFFDRIANLDIDYVRCIDGHKIEEGRGYYCISNEEPVCEEHSEKPKGWFPSGASRSRIYTDDWNKYGAWMS